MGTQAVVKPWNGGQTSGRRKQMKSDPGPFYSVGPGETTPQERGHTIRSHSVVFPFSLQKFKLPPLPT